MVSGAKVGENQGYRYQCVYCDKLRVFSNEDGAEVVDTSMIGKTIRLTQGQEIVISAATGGNVLEHILVGVGWDESLSGPSMDVDSSVIVKSSASGASELIYFGNKMHPSGCISHRGDNLVGGSFGDNPDSENIDVYLKKVPDNRDRLYFVLNIFECKTRNQNLGKVRNMYIRLTDNMSGKELCSYTVTSDLKNKTGMIIACMMRSGNLWKFEAIGKGINVANVHDIDTYCNDSFIH